jgi:glutamate carboxypeptidase
VSSVDPQIAAEAAELAEWAPAQLAALVDISSPSGDVPGAEAAVALCVSLLPPGAVVERPACSTPG